MLTQKRAFASTFWAQPSQLKRPRTAGTKSKKTRSWFIEKVVRRVVREEFREEWERVKSDLVECCQSSMENALKEMMQQISSRKSAVPKLMETMELTNDHYLHLGCANAKTMGKNDVGNLRLQIQAKLADPVFTGKRLEGDRGACISVALIDANTGDIVRSGPESSIELDVVVLQGDFNKDDEDNWTQEEFDNYVVKERERKGPLLTGDLQVRLKGGVGEVGELIFTDNSSWNRNKRFRIGLKVASGYCGNTRIREAKTDAFRVKEHRGESNKKNYPPASDDEVWRLEKIAKDGKIHQKLSEAGIHKVEDFLLQMFKDPKKLREVLGKSITLKNWECLVDHAKTCKYWEPYLDYPNGMRKHAAVFNTDHQLIGLNQDKMNSSISFPSQVFEGQIENVIPFQCNLAPHICAAPGGPGAPLANVGLTAEGHKDITASASTVQSQNTIIGNAQFSVDERVCFDAHQPKYADRLNIPISPAGNGITTVGLPVQSNDTNLQNAMHSEMIDSSSQWDHAVNESVPLFEPPYASSSGFPSSGMLPPESNHLKSSASDDRWDYFLTLIQTPEHDDMEFIF